MKFSDKSSWRFTTTSCTYGDKMKNASNAFDLVADMIKNRVLIYESMLMICLWMTCA